jgi:hypothetical protein
LAARTLQPTQVRTGYSPVSGSSARAVIAFLVYRVTAAGHPLRYGGMTVPAARGRRGQARYRRGLCDRDRGYRMR